MATSNTQVEYFVGSHTYRVYLFGMPVSVAPQNGQSTESRGATHSLVCWTALVGCLFCIAKEGYVDWNTFIGNSRSMSEYIEDESIEDKDNKDKDIELRSQAQLPRAGYVKSEHDPLTIQLRRIFADSLSVLERDQPEILVAMKERRSRNIALVLTCSGDHHPAETAMAILQCAHFYGVTVSISPREAGAMENELERREQAQMKADTKEVS